MENWIITYPIVFYVFFLLVCFTLTRSFLIRFLFVQLILPIILWLASIDTIFTYIIIIYLILISIGVILHLFMDFKRKQAISQITIIPEYRLDEKIKFYEIGALIDGKISNSDLNAYYIYHKLNPFEEEYNTTDNKLLEIYERTGGINKFTNRLAETKFQEIKTSNVRSFNYSYTDEVTPALQLISEHLKADGYFRFDSEAVELSLNKLIIRLLGISTILFILFYKVIFIFWIFFLIIIPIILVYLFVASFREDLNKILPIRKKLLGHKMFLETADFYRIQHDEKLFKELIPYFIAYGLHLDKVREALLRFGLIKTNS